MDESVVPVFIPVIGITVLQITRIQPQVRLMRPKQGTAIFFRAIMLQRKMMTIDSHVRVDVSASGQSLMIHRSGNPVRWGRSRKNLRDKTFLISFKPEIHLHIMRRCPMPEKYIFTAFLI